MKMVNPLSLDDRTESYGYRYYFGVLVAFVALSVGGNVLHGVTTTVPPWVVATSHGVPPLIFALMVHLGTTLASSFAGAMRRPGPRPQHGERHLNWSSLAVVVSLVAAVATVAAIALWVSFQGLMGLAATMGWASYAWTLPVLLDVPAGVATLGVLLATHAMRADERVVDVVVDPADDVAIDQPGDWLSTTPAVDDDHVDQPAVARRPVAVDHSDRSLVDAQRGVDNLSSDLRLDQSGVGDQQLVDVSVDHDSGVVIDQPGDWPSTNTEVAIDHVDQSAVDHQPVAIDQPGDGLSTTPVVDDDHPVDRLSSAATATADVVAIDEDAVAERVRAATGTTASVEQIAEALRLHREGGMSRRKIAEAVAVGSHSTVSGWIRAAAEVTDDRPRLAVVGRE